MSDDTAPLVVTLKAGTGFDVPWIVVRGDNPADVSAKLAGIDELIALTIDAANKFKAANSVAPIAAGGSVAQAVVAEVPASAPGWAQPAQQQAPPPQQAWGNNGGAPQQSVQVHPTDRCLSCGQQPIAKDVSRKSDGKVFKFWTCPNQKSRDDGHYSEFRN